MNVFNILDEDISQFLLLRIGGQLYAILAKHLQLQNAVTDPRFGTSACIRNLRLRWLHCLLN